MFQCTNVYISCITNWLTYPNKQYYDITLLIWKSDLFLPQEVMWPKQWYHRRWCGTNSCTTEGHVAQTVVPQEVMWHKQWYHRRSCVTNSGIMVFKSWISCLHKNNINVSAINITLKTYMFTISYFVHHM